jgi:hypothetical protein
MPSDRRDFSRISPIQMKSGSAVRVQLDSDPHTVSASASPPGRVVKSSMPSQATPSTAMPIHTPAPRMTNKATISARAVSVPIVAYSMLAASLGCGGSVRKRST